MAFIKYGKYGKYEQSYANATIDLNSAYSTRNIEPLVIDAVSNVIGENLFLAPKPTPPSGLAIHDEALQTLAKLNTLPLTTQLLERSQGIGSMWALQPKGPSLVIEKKFEAFIKALAAQRGCSVADLKKLGFQCKSNGELGLSIEFPEQDQANLFKQMINEDLVPSQLLDNDSDKKSQEEEESLRRMCP